MSSRTIDRGAPPAKLLSAEEEKGLIGRWTGARDQSALDRIVTAHRPLVLKIAARYRRYGHPMGDLVQEGHIGLLEAAHRFDPGRDVRFATYAQWWIKSAMQEFVLRNSGAVRTITSSRQKSLLFTMARMAADGAPIECEERARLASRFGVSLAAVDRLSLRMGVRDLSLDAGRAADGAQSLADVLACDRPGPEEAVLAEDETRHRAQRLAAALAALPPRERRIVEARHLRERPPLLREIGRDFGVSKERVRQLERRALARLKDLLAGDAATS